MRHSIFALLALATAASALPGRNRQQNDDTYGSPNGGGGGSGGGAYATPVTTQYAVECPTGLSTVQTVVTDIPAASSNYGDIIPGWTTTVAICSACEGQPEVTYTLPPGVSPTSADQTPDNAGDYPAEDPAATEPAATGPPATGYEPGTPAEGTPGPSETAPVGEETPAPTVPATTEPAPTGYEPAPPAEETPAPSSEETPVPSETAPTEGETPVPTESVPTEGETSAPSEPAATEPAATEPAAPTGYEPAPPGQETPAPTGETPVPTGETPAPSETTPAGETPVPTGETLVPTGETPAPSEPAPTGETPAPTEPGPTAGTPTEYVPVVSAPVPTAGEEVITTVVSCTFTDIGDSGLTTKTLEVTKEIPASATDESYTVSMTETITVCTVCGAEPTTVTLTIPAQGTPAEGAPETTPVPGASEAPATSDVPEATLTDGEPSAPSTTDYAPVVSAPVPTEGEEVITTVVSCTFTDIGDNGFITKTVEVTKEIPATASETTLTVSMTESVTVCTNCGAEPTTVTLTVPAQGTPVEGAPETTPAPGESGAPVTSDVPEATPTDGEPSAPSTTDYAPVVSAPVPTEGEEVITTVVSCTFTDIGDNGFTTKTVEVTKEIPATASETTLTVSMTESVTVCTNCGAEPTTVTLTVPAQETPAEDATTTADVPEATPTDGSPSTPSTTDYAPVVSAPVPTEGEEVITTVVSCTFTDIGDNGFTTKTVEVTKEIPATASETTLTVSMTESVTVCTNCGAEPTTVTLTVPAQETPAEDATTTADVPEATPTDGSPSTPSTTDYAPVVSAPVPTEGEEVITTVVSCTFTDIGDNGFTTKTVEVTKEIPATASETTLTVSMTESVTVCTNCGAEPTTVTLTVPAQETPAEDSTTTAGGAPETTAVDVVTSVPVVEVPTATAGEDVYTTVIQTTYVDVCPTGFTTKTVDITKEIPATITSTTLTVIMTESSVLCETGCGAGPTTVVVTIPVEETTTIKATPQPTDPSSPVPTTDSPATTTDSSAPTTDSPAPTDGSPQPTEPAPEATTVYETATREVPAVSYPAVTPGEEVITTVITKEYVTLCPTGLSTATTRVTAEVPASYTSPIEVVMTTTETLCSNCGANGQPTTVVLTVPVYETQTLTSAAPFVPRPTTVYQTIVRTITNGAGVETPETATEKIVTITNYQPITEVTTIIQTITNSIGEETQETVVSIPGYAPITEASQPVYGVVTETVYQTASDAVPTEAVVTETITTQYETVGSTGIEVVTVTITAEKPTSETNPVQIGYETLTTTCTVCGEGAQEVTMTIPYVTSTVTFVPTFSTIFASSSGFGAVPSNTTDEYVAPSSYAKAEFATQEFEGAASKGGVSMGLASLVAGAIMVVLM